MHDSYVTLSKRLLEISRGDVARAWKLIDVVMSEPITKEDLLLAAVALEQFQDPTILYFRARVLLKGGYDKEAFEGFFSEAKKGFPPSQWRAGRMLIYSKEVTVHDGENLGLNLLRKATEAGHLFAGRSYMIALSRRTNFPKSAYYRIRGGVFAIRGIWLKEIKGIYDTRVM
jgi:TPR repeat protein